MKRNDCDTDPEANAGDPIDDGFTEGLQPDGTLLYIDRSSGPWQRFDTEEVSDGDDGE
jgi:hypothetical protein